jgi:glucoamylase
MKPLHLPTAATGNALSLATFGASGEIMGFFYPHIDFAQNVREGMFAIFTPSRGKKTLEWCFGENWDRSQQFRSGTNILDTQLRHRYLGLTLRVTDLIPPGEQALVRRFTVERADPAAGYLLYQYFNLKAGDVQHRNAVQWLPDTKAVVQQYRDVMLAVAASADFGVQCGVVGPAGGSAVKRGMAHRAPQGGDQCMGNVDFALAFDLGTDPNWQVTLVLAGGRKRNETAETANRLAAADFEMLARAAADRSSRLLKKGTGSEPAFSEAKEDKGMRGACPLFQQMEAGTGSEPATGNAESDKAVRGDAPLSQQAPDPLEEFRAPFERAVLSLMDLYDESAGTFIAAPEFDPGFRYSGGYGYCWPRDAAHSALVTAELGFTEQTERFFEWCVSTQLGDGHWYQRYWVDGREAPAWCVRPDEIQLDQTCAVLHAAGRYARMLGEKEAGFIERFRPTARRAAAAITAHLDETGLHKRASDLWECRYGSFPYTNAAVIAALRAGREVFGLEAVDLEHLRRVLVERFYDPARNHWARRIDPEGHLDETADSSVLGLIEPWEVLDLDDREQRALALATIEFVERALSREVKGGRGILRFENEDYMGGGAGCVNTLWLAQCHLKLARVLTADERRMHVEKAKELMRTALANTNPVGQLPELIPNMNQFAYWAAPHAWASSLLIQCVRLLSPLEIVPGRGAEG